MPKPVHIICSQSGVEDKATSLASLFHILETIKFTKSPMVNVGMPLLQMQINATWMREDNDRGRQFEYETRALLPPDDAVFPIAQGKFEFAAPFQRIASRIIGVVPVTSAGLMRVQNRIRITGSEDWITQECPVLIEEMVPDVFGLPTFPPNN